MIREVRFGYRYSTNADLEHLWPQFAGDVEGVRVRVIGHAVEHINSPRLLGGQEA